MQSTESSTNSCPINTAYYISCERFFAMGEGATYDVIYAKAARSMQRLCYLYVLNISEDYICCENWRQIAIINYLFSVNFHGSIFSLFGYMSWKFMYWNIYN